MLVEPDDFSFAPPTAQPTAQPAAEPVATPAVSETPAPVRPVDGASIAALEAELGAIETELHALDHVPD